MRSDTHAHTHTHTLLLALNASSLRLTRRHSRSPKNSWHKNSRTTVHKKSSIVTCLLVQKYKYCSHKSRRPN